MIKKQLYPKTKRFPKEVQIQITEKLDGSNLSIYSQNGELFVATRNHVIQYEQGVRSSLLYRGLYEWLEQYGESLKNKLAAGSVLCGEWLGPGKIKYSGEFFENPFYMFAKARLDPNTGKLMNFCYDVEQFHYAFVDKKFPSFLTSVPIIFSGGIDRVPSVEELDDLYHDYVESQKRDVEGFVVSFKDPLANTVLKYVRMKKGKLTDHTA